MTLSRLRGRPRLPVRSLTASSSGRTWARSSPLAGVVRLANGIPEASVRLWIKIPLPFPPRATPSPPPLPGGKSAIDGAIFPMNHAGFFGKAQNPRLHGSEGAIRLPALQPAMCCALRRPLRSTRDITPATAGDQNVEQGIQYCPKRCMGHPPTTLLRGWGQDILKQAPL